MVNPDINSTIDAAALCKMADRGQIRGAMLDGPLAFDNAISEIAARTKSIDSPVAGRADILLVPNIEAGNMLAKQLQYFAGADSAGIVLGARVPVILTSRADNVRMRIGSAAVAKLVVHARRAAARHARSEGRMTAATERAILVLNAGSSSIKFCVFRLVGGQAVRDLRGQVSGLGTVPRFTLAPGWRAGHRYAARAWPDESRRCARSTARGGPGGTRRRTHRRASVIASCMAVSSSWRRRRSTRPCCSASISTCRSRRCTSRTTSRRSARCWRDCPACPRSRASTRRSTAPSRTSRSVSRLPPRFAAAGVRRYGFHGLSYEYIATQLPAVDARAAEGRTVVFHLGNGSSMCAMRACRSIATTMGFTAVDGLPMGTRCGAMDPGVVLFLMDEMKLGPREIERLIYNESGLLGMSGVSSDVRDLLASSEPDAALALDVFVYRAGRELGSLAAALGGLDAIVFTAGIGENQAGDPCAHRPAGGLARRARSTQRPT